MLESSTSSASTTTALAGGDAGETFARLHIRPLDADLIKVVVPAAVLPKVRNVSYHTLQTFPENRYGFVELPTADAEKLKRKFHGSTLRGSKMKVEKAKPEKVWEPEEEEDTGKKRKKKSSEEREGRTKKRKTDYNTVEGVLLPEDRKVKRGWTTTTEEMRREKKGRKSKDKDKDKAEKKGRKVKSKYTDKEECLMKTVLPANAPNAGEAVAKNKNKKKKGKSKREVVVHEFENTTKYPSFLKGSADAAPTAATSKLPTYPGLSNATTGEEAKPEDIQAAINDARDDSDSDSDSSDEEQPAEAPQAKPDSDSSDEDSDAESDPPTDEKNEDIPMSSPTSARPRSSASVKNLSIQIPPATPAASKEVHPLEALYKKSKEGEDVQAAPADAEPFSFFNRDGSDEEDEDEDKDEDANEDGHAPSSQPPMTPYTKQDFDQRHIRSAAPTPDTAHPSRMRMFWAPNGEDDLQEEDEPDSSPVRNGAVARGGDEGVGGERAGAGEGAKESDFHSWFYDNRREINRSWMDRRKAARKERRQRDNRAKGR